MAELPEKPYKRIKGNYFTEKSCITSLSPFAYLQGTGKSAETGQIVTDRWEKARIQKKAVVGGQFLRWQHCKIGCDRTISGRRSGKGAPVEELEQYILSLIHI